VDYKKEFPQTIGVTNLDSAATGLVPAPVADFVFKYTSTSCANAGRSAYRKSVELTARIDFAREEIAGFFGAKTHELTFTPGATHALNWVAKGLNINCGDVIVLTKADHHANILPWMDLKKQGVQIRWVECDKSGQIDVTDFRQKVEGAKLAAFTGASNVTGAIQPIDVLVKICKEAGCLSVIDSAQLAPHKRVNFDELGADFMAIAGHKMMAPKGIGLLLANENSSGLLSPLIVGGGVIRDVTLDGYELQPFPIGFESGTPCVEGILGLHKLTNWLIEKGEDLYTHESELADICEENLRQNPKVKVIRGNLATPVMAINVEGWQPHKLAVKLDADYKIAVRSGHMCALPLVRDVLGYPEGLMRISFAAWNTHEDVEAVVCALREISNVRETR
jgi:cysteine desulfurase/selenocysteine lyase